MSMWRFGGCQKHECYEHGDMEEMSSLGLVCRMDNRLEEN
jgi:hypothetical protein